MTDRLHLNHRRAAARDHDRVAGQGAVDQGGHCVRRFYGRVFSHGLKVSVFKQKVHSHSHSRDRYAKVTRASGHMLVERGEARARAERAQFAGPVVLLP